jgi:hypothetical protein
MWGPVQQVIGVIFSGDAVRQFETFTGEGILLNAYT